MIFRVAVNNKYGEYVHIYTDGSKDPFSGETGIAIYIEPSLNTKAIIYRAVSQITFLNLWLLPRLLNGPWTQL